MAWGAFAQTPVAGRFVRVAIPKDKATLSLAEVQVFSKGANVALKGIASENKEAYGAAASRAIDGNTDTLWGGNSITHTPENEPNPWWEVDLRADVPIEKIVIWNRSDYPSRLYGCSVMILGKDRRVQWERTLPKPEDKATTLAVDAAEKSAAVGNLVPGYVAPASDAEIAAAYEKRDTWVESVLATQDKLEAFRNLRVIASRLMLDFPSAKREISEEFAGTGIYQSKQSGAFEELARRYVGDLPEPMRKEWGAKAKTIKTMADLAPLREAFREGRTQMLKLASLDYFNADALERAIRTYAAKYPQVYADRDALLKRLAEVRKVASDASGSNDFAVRLSAARQIDALTDAVYLKHPAVDFKELLFVRRSTGSVHTGLPQNWQCNSSVPLQGYVNDVERAPLKQGDRAPEIICESSCFIGDVDLDFDAERIMYSSGKPGEQGWRVFESQLSQPGSCKEITPPDQNDIDFYDPCYLPDGRRLFVASSGFHGVPCVGGSDYVGNLHLMEKDGSIRRLCFDQDNNWCPTVMPNGRILYLRWEYTDSAHYFSRVLMTMNPDGSDQQEFYGSGSYWPNSCFYARPLPGSTTKFVGIVSGHHGLARKGELVLFDAARGRLETAGGIQQIPGYGKPVENITKDQLVNGAVPLFLHPYPLSDELFLVSMSRSQGGPFFIALADIYDNFVPLWQSSFDNLYEPLPLKKQPKPILPTDRYVKGENECSVYMVNVNQGPGLRGLPHGKVKSLRVFNYEYSPRNMGGHYEIGFEGPWDPRVILGTVDVEADGSCSFKMPANTPFSVQPLDENGNAMQLMRSWLVGVPGETIACMGCHEKQNAAAPHVLSMASRKKPQAVKPWYGPRRNFAFEREVQNVLDASCVGCHNAKATAKNRLGQPIPSFENTSGDGGFSTAYVSLIPYVRRNGPEGDYHILTPLEFHADTSELVQILKKGHHGVVLSQEQWDRLNTWIDLNVPYWGTWTERSAGKKEECLRRRHEMMEKYANVDFNPETIIDPYKPVEFKAPQKPADPAPAPSVADWPFDAAAAKAKQGANGAAELDLGDGQILKLAKIPAGSFAMGCNDETPVERPVTAVTIGKPFWMGATEITMAQFRQFDPTFENGVYDKHYKDQVNRGYFMNESNFPAIRVSWEQANAFCAWLSKKTGKTVRLPTEAQWEWACRAGTATPMNYGDINADFSKHENLADYTMIEMAVSGVDPKPIAYGNDPNPKQKPSPLWDYELRDRRYNDGVLHLANVGRYEPNAWGLYDMHGNVAEWTRSAYRPYPYVEDDGRNSTTVDERKVVRGGSWYRRQIRATSSWRWGYPGWMKPFDVGFRVIVEE